MLQIFIRICSICLMICAGALARRRGVLNSDSTRSLAFLSTNFIYPAAVYSSLVGNFTLGQIASKWTLPAGALMVFVVGFAVGAAGLLLLRSRRECERRMFHFQSTLCNYVFLPMPLVLYAFGDAGVGLLSLSTVGSEIGVWTVGIIAISGGFSLKQLRNMLNMPMIAVILSIITLAFKEFLPWTPAPGSLFSSVCASLLSTAKMFGAGTVAIAMIVAGSRMTELNSRSLLNGLQLFTAFVRLVAVPAVCIALIYLLPFAADVRNILVIVAVMPASVASVAIGDIFGGDNESIAASVLLTHILCILTVPAWLWLCGDLFGVSLLGN